ncbi:MAG: hypothetical protein WAU58_19555 [Terriglobales bacterium]
MRNVKKVTSLLHLLMGVVLLAIAGYFFRAVGHEGKMLWQRESSRTVAPVRFAESLSASDDPTLSAANLQAYGVLAEQNGAAGGGDAAPAPSSPPSLLDHVNAADAGAANHFLHGRLAIETYQIFEFVVPPHAIHPQLKGRFRSVAARRNQSGGAVELLLMSESEFAGFAHNKPGTAAFSADPSSRGEIHWELNAGVANPQKYYLVFRNSSEGQGPSIVDADFTASFE